ncbi:archaetidylserine synthase [Methanobacterium alcaliphilum]|uniref:archaetidylserine synthase n=1 Tax=Methanobacterium alcaliphilum TaxID=392018 RepID=UPI00200A07ED|nr:archaetidylserine synthase [Methanobacterium alcaliphilum]MCK9150389.1 archaetidylserine synthase [Methanobacterium alcaliphilum]
MSSNNLSILDFISIPDLFSILNASFGFLAIVMVINGELILAAQFMLISVIFDSIDGWVARKTNRNDECGFGKNIDSLCDVISFGVAPGIFLYFATLTQDIRYINILVSLLIVICGILRLSRFNVISDIGTIKDKFVGLPIPTTAVVLSSFYLSGFFTKDISIIIMGTISILMISTIEYPKIKNVKIASIALILILMVCLPQNIQISIMNIPAKALFILSIIYLIFTPFMALFTNLKSGPHVR